MRTHYGKWRVITTKNRSALVECRCGYRTKKSLWDLEKGKSKQCRDCYQKQKQIPVQPAFKPVEEPDVPSWLYIFSVVGSAFIILTIILTLAIALSAF